MIKLKTKFQIAVTAIFCMALLFGLAGELKADTVSELRNKIQNSNSEIGKLEEEIKQYQKNLQITRQEASTLQNELKRIETTQKKHAADINLTEKKINNTSLNIEKLNFEISQSEQKINQNKEAIAELMRQIRETESHSLVEIFLSQNSLSEFLQATEELQKLQVEIQKDMENLVELKTLLEQQKSEEESRNQELGILKSNLVDQKTIADQNAREQSVLLAATKNKESEFQKLIAEKQARKLQFEQSIKEAEAQIKIIIDPNKLPDAGSAVLSWPLDNVIITQYFGNTAFASRNAQIYNGNGHNGIDLGTPTGTELKSSAGGRVVGVGDTDNTCQGASYGKWVLVQHNNGLSTLYAHMSLIRVQPGQEVGQGQIIGFSGNTGYSTGPHLHFTVFATEGVKVGQLQSQVPGCGVYTLPLASKSSYLNPLSYLPAL